MLKSSFSKFKNVSLQYLMIPRFNFSSTAPYHIHQFNTPCLAEFAYYIESNGEAAIIDPLRDIKPYLEMAESRKAKIKYIFETHFHADFVSGHLDLAKATGAKIIYGPNAQAEFNIHAAKDGEVFSIGEIAVKVLHTPGHTMESSCFLLLDEKKQPNSVFTGDTLFLGEVGRPDLAVKSNLTKEDLAGLLYDSLHKKLMSLDDNVIVYPGHGAGSACGKNISRGSFCTIGQQRKTNYALQPMSKETFINVVAGDLPTPPKYFFHDATVNKKGYDPIDEVLKKGLTSLPVNKVKELVSQGAVVIDCRDQKNCLETGIIPGSVAISLALPFAVWTGTLLNPQDKIVIIADAGKEEEAVVRLARVGFDNCVGYLEGGVQEWTKQNNPVEALQSVGTRNYIDGAKKAQKIEVIDVRNKPEWSVGVYPGSTRIPLGELEKRVNELRKDKEYYILCKSGMRSVVAYSLLKRNGFNNLVIIEGGADALVKEGFKLEEFQN